MNGTQSQSRYTVWHFIGCGCTVLIVLGLIAAGGIFWFGKQMVDGVAAGFRDPEVRAERNQEILGYDELPEGYYPGVTLKMPFVMEMASLGDRELPVSEEVDEEEIERQIEEGFGDDFFDRRGFLFMKMRAFGDSDPKAEFEGDLDLDIDVQRQIAEGTVEAGGAEVHYVARTGYRTARRRAEPAEPPEASDGSPREIEEIEEIERMSVVTAELMISCLESPYVRFALWFTPGPEDPSSDPTPETVAGTAADPDALRAFLDHFDLCR